MTSGNFTDFPVSKIWVDRSKRIRKVIEQDAVDEKAESMARLGLIHPIVIKRDGELIAGETRWTAAQKLGWETIHVQFQDEIDEETLIAIELEENVKRRDLPWQDKVDALAKFHEMKKKADPNWRQEDTAEAIGFSQGEVSRNLTVAEQIKAGNTRVKEAKEFSVAHGIAKRVKERQLSDEVLLLQETEEVVQTSEAPIINADFCEWAAGYTGPPFNLIHCDFPYGINADTFNQGSAELRGGYSDDFNTYEQLCQTLRDNKSRLMGGSCHLMFWFSMKHYDWTLKFLREEMQLWVDPYPLVWFKTCNSGTLPDPQRGPRRVYEVAFLASHGDRKILSAVANTYGAPVVRSADHMSEKSEDMLAHFFRMLVDGTSRILDPTCGSGSALRAARRLGAGNILGIEKNSEFARSAREAWERASIIEIDR